MKRILLSSILFLQTAVIAKEKVLSKPIWEFSVSEVRAIINEGIEKIEAETPSVFSTETRSIDRDERHTPICIYKPSDEANLPAILLIHGGAWVAGSIETHDNLARYLCKEAGAALISVGYLNSPEGKFPYPLEQCCDVFLWLKEHAQELSINSSKIAVAGDSAGGNLASALCLMLRDRKKPLPLMQVLINPTIDLRCKGTLERQDDAMDLIRWQALQYLPSAEAADHPYASPLAAEDLSNLPLTLVLVGENDPLRPPDEEFAKKLSAAGVLTEIYCQKGVGHLAGDGAKASLRARESLEAAVAALRKAFNR